jgi:pyridoxine 5-phosphate synthase
MILREVLAQRLGVNIDHVATIRNARGGRHPDPLRAAHLAIEAGADGITAHLREDRRHISDADIAGLKRELTRPLNLEMAATDEMVGIASRIKPEMAMLVPEGRHEVTTEGGLNILASETALRTAVAKLRDAGIVVSVFIDADLRQVEAAQRIGASVCEVHTGPYAHAFHSKGRDAESPAVVSQLQLVQKAGEAIRARGMRFNAGHALNYFNVEPVARLPGVRELHIGHAIVSRAVFVGMREAVREMKGLMQAAASSAASSRAAR